LFFCFNFAFRQHNVVPEPALVSRVTHVVLAFVRSDVFNVPGQDDWPLFTTVPGVRPKFPDATQVQIAIGGWGDTDGFSKAAKTVESRKLFAQNIKAMIDSTGADGWSTSTKIEPVADRSRNRH
jgi:hypothetical protein